MTRRHMQFAILLAAFALVSVACICDHEPAPPPPFEPPPCEPIPDAGPGDATFADAQKWT